VNTEVQEPEWLAKMTPDERAKHDLHNQFGSFCAGSRWFSGEPDFQDKKMVPVKRRWMCPIPDCGGEMKSAGYTWPTGNPGYHHTCDNKDCEFTAAIKGGTYPRVVYVEAADE
jgi:hypothetical protein